MYVCMYVCTHVCMYVCMHGCMYVGRYVCTCMFDYMYIHIIFIHTYIYISMQPGVQDFQLRQESQETGQVAYAYSFQRQAQCFQYLT